MSEHPEPNGTAMAVFFVGLTIILGVGIFVSNLPLRAVVESTHAVAERK